MKKIKLRSGNHAIVDDGDFEYLNQWVWSESWNGYAVRGIHNGGHYKTIRMHRVIARTPDGLFTDHINQNKLDNRRINLRICDKSANGFNRGPQVNNTSGYKGVTFEKQTHKYVARVRIKGKTKTIGRYSTPKEAAVAYEAYLESIL